MPPATLQRDSDQERDETCEHLYRTLYADVGSLAAPAHAQSGSETSLYNAFSTLFHYYEGDPLQAAVCARVMAFYFLMERSAGAVLAAWTQAHPGISQFVDLHPAVIEAIASVRLRGSVLLSERVFVDTVAKLAATPHRGG